jgi:hypothetical protein
LATFFGFDGLGDFGVKLDEQLRRGSIAGCIARTLRCGFPVEAQGERVGEKRFWLFITVKDGYDFCNPIKKGEKQYFLDLAPTQQYSCVRDT